MKFTSSYKLLNEPEKAVISLMILDKVVMQSVTTYLSDSELLKITNTMKSLGAVDHPVIIDILEELEIILMSPGILVGNEDIAKKMIQNNIHQERSKRILQKFGVEEEDPGMWNELNSAPISDIIGFLSKIGPQVAALILTKLNTNKAASIISMLPIDHSCKIVASILDTTIPHSSVMVDIEEAIYEEFIFNKTQSINSIRLVADILQDLEKDKSSAIQKYLANISPDITSAIVSLMFAFEDIGNIPGEGIKIIMEEANRETLLYALKGADEKLRDKFMSSLPKIARGLINNDIDALGTVNAQRIKQAQSEIVQLLIKLEQKGLISIDREV